MIERWRPIATAPTDGTVVWVYTAASYGFPAFQGPCAYHEDAGWCTDELRPVTHWVPLQDVYLPPPIQRPVNEALQQAILQARKDNATLREALRPRARDPLEQAIASVKERAHLRKGQPPSTDEILLMEVERLRALVQSLQDHGC